MRVRFAPSPTGALHIGGARTALYNWLLARGAGGQFVLRIEDTDRERSTPENVEQILDALSWLELDWDEGPIPPVRARARAPGRDRAAPRERARLRGRGRRPDQGPGRGRGRREGRDPRRRHVPASALDDFVIARSDGSALYNLAVAVDDRDMGITHVVRGEDHLSNTPAPAPDPAGAGRRAARRTRTCRCCTAPTGRSCRSATAPPRCRSSARTATCRTRCATTSRCSAGATTRARRSSPPTS